MAQSVRRRTGSNSVAVNRIVGAVDARISLRSNCAVTMISARTYREYLLTYDQQLARDLYPYGIHHCGVDMRKVCREYARVDGAEFFAVGWGSNVAACRAALPNAIFSLRMSPVRVATMPRAQVIADAEALLRAAGPLERAALCCIHLDERTPNENVRALFQVAERYRRYGA